MSLRRAREIEKKHGWKQCVVDLRWLVPLNEKYIVEQAKSAKRNPYRRRRRPAQRRRKRGRDHRARGRPALNGTSGASVPARGRRQHLTSPAGRRRVPVIPKDEGHHAAATNWRPDVAFPPLDGARRERGSIAPTARRARTRRNGRRGRNRRPGPASPTRRARSLARSAREIAASSGMPGLARPDASSAGAAGTTAKPFPRRCRPRPSRRSACPARCAGPRPARTRSSRRSHRRTRLHGWRRSRRSAAGARSCASARCSAFSPIRTACDNGGARSTDSTPQVLRRPQTAVAGQVAAAVVQCSSERNAGIATDGVIPSTDSSMLSIRQLAGRCDDGLLRKTRARGRRRRPARPLAPRIAHRCAGDRHFGWRPGRGLRSRFRRAPLLHRAFDRTRRGGFHRGEAARAAISPTRVRREVNAPDSRSDCSTASAKTRIGRRAWRRSCQCRAVEVRHRADWNRFAAHSATSLRLAWPRKNARDDFRPGSSPLHAAEGFQSFEREMLRVSSALRCDPGRRGRPWRGRRRTIRPRFHVIRGRRAAMRSGGPPSPPMSSPIPLSRCANAGRRLPAANAVDVQIATRLEFELAAEYVALQRQEASSPASKSGNSSQGFVVELQKREQRDHPPWASASRSSASARDEARRFTAPRANFVAADVTTGPGRAVKRVQVVRHWQT